MHGRGKTAAAPASDSATRERRRCPHVRPRPATCLFFFLADSRWRCSDSARFALNRAKRPIQAMAEAKPAWQRRRLLLLLFVLLLPAWQRQRLLLLRFVRSFFFFSCLRFVHPFQFYFKFSLPCFMFCELSTWVDLALFYVCELSTWVDVRNDKEIWQNFIFTGHT